MEGKRNIEEALAHSLKELVVSSDRSDRYSSLTEACGRGFLVPPHVFASLSDARKGSGNRLEFIVV